MAYRIIQPNTRLPKTCEWSEEVEVSADDITELSARRSYSMPSYLAIKGSQNRAGAAGLTPGAGFVIVHGDLYYIMVDDQVQRPITRDVAA